MRRLARFNWHDIPESYFRTAHRYLPSGQGPGSSLAADSTVGPGQTGSACHSHISGTSEVPQTCERLKRVPSSMLSSLVPLEGTWAPEAPEDTKQKTQSHHTRAQP